MGARVFFDSFLDSVFLQLVICITYQKGVEQKNNTQKKKKKKTKSDIKNSKVNLLPGA